MRDTRKPKEYFDKWISYNYERIGKMRENIETFPSTISSGQLVYLHNYFAKHYQQLFMSYSRGDDSAGLRDRLTETLSAWELFNKGVSTVSDGSEAQYQILTRDNYPILLALLAFGVCLELPQHVLRKALLFWPRKTPDALFDAIRSRIDAGDVCESNSPLYDKNYSPLLAIVTSTSKDVGTSMSAFLKTWYKRCCPDYWSETHLEEDTGYVGYWAFESSLIVKLWRIDDSAFADQVYYPKDLLCI